jgi:hypothetical protein
MTRTQVKVLIVGLLVMGGFGFALFGGAIPGLKPNYSMPSVITLDGEPYYYTTVTLNWPGLLSNYTEPQSFVFHNVSFWLWITNWGSPSGALVHGNGTEPNGTVFSFVLGESFLPAVNNTLFIAPDHAFAVSYGGGILGGPWVELMVHV